ncbi:MAG: hypothetical protein ACLSUM_00745 [Dysosmobacter welbionis]
MCSTTGRRSPRQTVLNKTYIWGTDSCRDLFIRVVYGARAHAGGRGGRPGQLIVGVLYGGIAGCFGGAVDSIMMRIVDTISSIPMMLMSFSSWWCWARAASIILAMGLTYWGHGAHRPLPGAHHAEQEFVSAAVLLGVPTRRSWCATIPTPWAPSWWP